MSFFKSVFSVSDEDIRYCVYYISDRIMSIQANNVDMKEILIVSQFILMRLAYQNGKSSADLIGFIRSEDKYMEKVNILSNSEIRSFRKNRVIRFEEYEIDWEMILKKDTTGFFINARHHIFTEEANTMNVHLPYSQIIAMSLGLAQQKIGNIKFEEDNWLQDFHSKLKI